MFRGVEASVSGRRWGRAGVTLIATVALAGGCATSPTPSSAGSARSVGANARVEASTEGAAVPIAPPPAVAATEAPIPAAPEKFTGPPPPAQPAPRLSTPARAVATGTGVWAVVIGINDYPGSSHDLRSARNDAADMDAALARYRVPAQQRVLLYDGQASSANIRKSLDWLVANAGPEATAVFFFAGHVRKLGSRSEAMVGSDGRTVADNEMAQRLSGLRARSTWLVMAACYGGGFNEALGPGRILTAAAPANEIAYESTELRRSYLGEYLTHRAMLQGNADGSVEQAFAYALEGLKRDHPNRLPVQYDELPGELVLGTPAAPAPRSGTSGSASGPPPPTTSTTAPPPNGKKQCLIQAGALVTC